MIKDHTYVDRYQAFSSPRLFQVLILVCLNLSFQEVKNPLHHQPLCLTQLDIISLSQKVDLHSKIFSSIFMYRSIPKPPIPPRANPRAFDFFENFGQIPRYVASLDGQMPYPLELQRGSNPPPSREKRIAYLWK